MDIVAYNLRMGGSAAHWHALEEAFAPDLVLAQESLRPPAGALGAAAATCWAAVPGHRWGSAIVVRRGTLTPVPVPGYEGWVLAADVDGPAADPLRVVSVHVPAGRGGYVAVADRLLDRLALLADGRPLLLGGDFNVAVGRWIDYEPRRNRRSQLALLDRLERELGLVPAWQRAHPGQPLAQTLRWTANPATPYHCDGVFIPVRWAESAIEARVVSGPDWDRRSDHNPVVVRVPAIGASRHGRSRMQPAPGSRGTPASQQATTSPT